MMSLTTHNASIRDERGGVTTEVVVIGVLILTLAVFSIGVLRGKVTHPEADLSVLMVRSLVVTAAAAAAVAVGLVVTALLYRSLAQFRVRRVTSRMSAVGPTFSDLRYDMGLPQPSADRIDAVLDALREYWERNPHQSLANIVDRHAGALNRELGIRRPASELEDEALLAMLQAGTNSSSKAARTYVQA